MSAIARTYTFTDGTDAYGSQVEVEFNTIYNAWNNHDSGISSWTTPKASGDMTITGASKGIVLTTPDGLHTYRVRIDNTGTVGTEIVT